MPSDTPLTKAKTTLNPPKKQSNSAINNVVRTIKIAKRNPVCN